MPIVLNPKPQVKDAPLFTAINLCCIGFGRNKNKDYSHYDSGVIDLLQRGANPNVGRNKSYGNYPTMPLGVAVLFGDKNLVKMLIHFGADVNLMDLNNKTPLDYARGKCLRDYSKNWDPMTVEEILLSQGAKSRVRLGNKNNTIERLSEFVNKAKTRDDSLDLL